MTVRVFRRAAVLVRHLPGLRRAEWLWALLRKPYHVLLGSGGRGVSILVGGKAEVAMPAEFTGGEWEKYEPETIAKFAEWVRRNPAGVVLDLGSSIGIFSAVALFADPEVEVVAFDSDLASLAATRRMCQYATGDRLRLVYGFVAESPTERVTLVEAVASTTAALVRSGVRGDPGALRYVCIADANTAAVPARRLDDLFGEPPAHGRRMLIKCDVEGAELLVLLGAKSLLQHGHTEMLLSVHPPALPAYGHTVEQVRAFVEGCGYAIECFAVDHEEHWWCKPALPRAC